MNTEKNLQELDLMGTDETQVENFQFLAGVPAVSVYSYKFYFNTLAQKLLTSKRYLVSIAGPYIVFRPTANQIRSYKVTSSGSSYMASIAAKHILDITGRKPGGVYKLYTVKGGGVAINMDEPLNKQ